MDKIVISEHLEDLNKVKPGSGNCKKCGTLVQWTARNLSSHKRANCDDPDFNEKYPTVPRTLRIEKTQDLSEIVMSEWMKDIHKIKPHSGTCRKCGKLVYWTRLSLASHKRAKCNDEEFNAKHPTAPRRLATLEEIGLLINVMFESQCV